MQCNGSAAAARSKLDGRVGWCRAGCGEPLLAVVETVAGTSLPLDRSTDRLAASTLLYSGTCIMKRATPTLNTFHPIPSSFAL